uniref:PAP_central domain-containing protein n=1 Tax=Meloidogyne hapla TaxID=6305 RepID=A0A1I8B4N9_MELHA
MPGVDSLFKIDGRVPLLKLKYLNYDFDLLFVQVPCVKPHEIYPFLRKEIKENLNLEETDKIINQIIFNLKTQNIEDIRSVILPLSEHFIYSGQFGFFNGTNLAVLASKIILLNNTKDQLSIELAKPCIIGTRGRSTTKCHRLTIYQLIHYLKDFVKLKASLNWDINSDYNKRHQLYGLNFYKIYDENKRRLERHANLQWPIIAPGIPKQNSGFNINLSTSKILLSEMKSASKSLKNVQNILENYNNKNKIAKLEEILIKNTWVKWLDGGLFEEKYDHFMAIISINKNPKNSNNEIFESFNNFVETRIRLQLIFYIENISEINYCHANPGRVWNSEKCPEIILNKGKDEQEQNINYVNNE